MQQNETLTESSSILPQVLFKQMCQINGKTEIYQDFQRQKRSRNISTN